MPHVADLFDPSTDFEDVVDGLEAVTLDRRGSTPNTDVEHALQRAITNTEAESATGTTESSKGLYRMGDVRWHLPDVEVGTAPRLGDAVVDASGNRYTVIDAQHATLEARWRLVGRNLRMVFQLDDTITLLRATYAKSTGGAAEPTWHTWRTVDARIQPQTFDIGVENEAKRLVKTVDIFIAESLAINTEHRVRGRNGQLYKITSYENAKRIGELSTISAEVTPWPLA